MSVKGSFQSIAKFSKGLRELPRVLAQQAAREAAPELTKLGRATFNRSETPYGVPWAPSVEGGKVTLRESGALARHLYYVAIGTKLRVALGVPYAKYQIGKRPVFPTQGGRLPLAYSNKLREAVERVCLETLPHAA